MSFKNQFTKLIAALLISLTLWPPMVAIAHPHILIDSQISFHLSKAKDGQFSLDSLHYVWQFDENFSLLLLGDYDDDQNQILNQKELSTMGIETMEGAKALGYFTHLFDGKLRMTPSDAPQVRATFKDNRLILEFDLTLPQSLSISNDFKYTLFDEEYYTAFTMQQDLGYQIIGQDTDNCAIYNIQQGQIDSNIKTALENAFTQDFTNQGLGAQFADDIGIKCS